MCETGMATLAGTLGFRTVFWTLRIMRTCFLAKKKKLDSIKVKVRTRS